jgi:hypothetical protein
MVDICNNLWHFIEGKESKWRIRINTDNYARWTGYVHYDIQVKTVYAIVMF